MRFHVSAPAVSMSIVGHRSFVANMHNNPEAVRFVRALVGLGHGLGLTVTAEGVEQSTQAAALLEQGCEQAQGFLYSGAIPAADTINFISAHGARARSFDYVA